MAMDPSKTESATPRKREEARKRGQVARSVELNTALGLLGVWILMRFWGTYMLLKIAGLSRYAWGNLGKFSLTFGEFQRYLLVFALEFCLLLGPLFLGVFFVSVLSNVLQFGFLFSTEPLNLKFDNLNPVNGFRRMFSKRSGVEILKNVFKILLVGLVAWLSVRFRLGDILLLLNTDLGLFLGKVADLSSQLLLNISFTLLCLAA